MGVEKLGLCFKMRSASDSFIFESLLEFENAGELLDCRYEITDETGVVFENTAEFSVNPMSRCEIAVPELKKLSDRAAYIRFIFTQNHDTLFCNTGYEVCFDQVKLGEISIKPQVKDRTPVFLTDSAFFVHVSVGKLYIV